MLCVPTASALVLQLAVRMLPLPPTDAAEHPATDVPPSKKLTLPVGALPVTVAVNVAVVPTDDGVREVAMPTVLATLLTVWESAGLLEGPLLASPLYMATMLC